MNRVERLTALLLLLQERRRTAESLSQEMMVARRTILRDIQSLNAMGVPIRAVSGPNGGLEIARDSTLVPLHLTWREALLLMLAVGGLAKMTDTPFMADRASLIAKLRSMMTPLQRSRVDDILETVTLEVPQRPERTPLLEELIQFSGRWVELVYDDSARLVRIDEIRSDRGLWYVRAASAKAETRIFRADRISAVALAEAPESVVEAKPYDHPDHPLVVVVLSKLGARRIQSDPHLGPQIAGPGRHEFRCPPSELDWFARFFMSFGKDAHVEAPPELVSRIRDAAIALIDQYV